MLQVLGDAKSERITFVFPSKGFNILSSADLAVLVELHKRMKAAGGALILGSVPSGIRAQLDRLKLDSFFEINEEAAAEPTAAQTI